MLKSGERETEPMREAMVAIIQAEPLAKIEYVSITDTVSLQDLDQIRSQALVSLAVRIGKTRLIDNIILG
jgi:pantoate--beta-alanine ligase